ncbi:hypothetical protein JVT61DRAFT_866 [Boletus reticuloceps]|uniref:Uncharacterized protein n=1 Tax=Boletus reticuloceps TaxID=495285 RepID=A0A8I2YRG8_9AGAM|nr:hypothetical protein JVT61DRAFT_866 [Boletus reticuloceps]
MSTPYHCEHAQDLMYMKARRGLVNEHYSRSSVTNDETENTMGNSASLQCADAYMHRYPVHGIIQLTSPTYQRAVLREEEMLFGAASRSIGMPTPSLAQSDITSMTADYGFSTEDVIQGPEVAQSTAHLRVTTVGTFTHSCLATMHCQWRGEANSEPCGAQIACGDVPAHFKNAHGIKELNEDTQIYCWWEGCQKLVKRKFFVRHVRERHLRHVRKRNHTLKLR